MVVGGRGTGGGRKNAGRSARAESLRARVKLAGLIGLALGATWFAVEGGEYGTFDLVRQGRAEARLRTELDSLRVIVDSLEAYRKQVLTDPLVQERIAREEFGMVKGPHELIYRFADPPAPQPAAAAPDAP